LTDYGYSCFSAFIAPALKGEKLKNQHVPLPAGRQALGIQGKNMLIFKSVKVELIINRKMILD
jgi:hypothetical protein